MTHTTKDIAQLFPDLMQINDALLRDKVAAVWTEALTTGCGGKGWTFDELRAIPFTLLAGDIQMTFIDHLNSCCKQCIAIARVLRECFGTQIPINLDYLIAGSLLADCGKPLPINVDGAIGAILADLGFPYEVMNGLFMIARTPGLIAHVAEEQSRCKPMRKIDPESHSYDGPSPRKL